MGPSKNRLRAVIELTRPLTESEYDFFTQELDEWLYNAFQDWDDYPFGNAELNCAVLKIR